MTSEDKIVERPAPARDPLRDWAYYVDLPKVEFDIIPNAAIKFPPDDSLPIVRVAKDSYNEGFNDCLKYMQKHLADMKTGVLSYQLLSRMVSDLDRRKVTANGRQNSSKKIEQPTGCY